MPKSLLDILHRPHGSVSRPMNPNPLKMGYQPLPKDVRGRAFLDKLTPVDAGEPYENDFTMGVKAFNRGANHFGHDQISYDDLKTDPLFTTVEEYFDELPDDIHPGVVFNALAVLGLSEGDVIKISSAMHDKYSAKASDAWKAKDQKAVNKNMGKANQISRILRHGTGFVDKKHAVNEDTDKEIEHARRQHRRAKNTVRFQKYRKASDKDLADARQTLKDTRGKTGYAAHKKLDEHLGKNASSGTYVDDFVHSKNSKFAGKSKKERIRMALGAYYHNKEETEISEVSKHLLKNYLANAVQDYGKTRADFRTAHHREKEKASKHAVKRYIGINAAARKLAGHSFVHATEETQLDEISKKLASRYVRKAAVSLGDNAYNAGKSASWKDWKHHNKKTANRTRGLEKAADKLSGSKFRSRVPATEETITELKDAKVTTRLLKRKRGFAKVARKLRENLNELFGKGSLKKIAKHHDIESSKHIGDDSVKGQKAFWGHEMQAHRARHLVFATKTRGFHKKLNVSKSRDARAMAKSMFRKDEDVSHDTSKFYPTPSTTEAEASSKKKNGGGKVPGMEMQHILRKAVEKIMCSKNQKALGDKA